MLKPALIIIYIFLNWLYLPLSARKVKYYWQTKIDQFIPLVPFMVVPYISYFLLFFGGSLALIFSERFFAFAKAMIIAQTAAVIFWYFFPNGVKRPSGEGSGWARFWLRRLYHFDRHDANGFPSAHTYHALIVGYFLATMMPQFRLLIYSWAGLIVISTVTAKQHYFVDTAGGIMLAILALSL